MSDALRLDYVLGIDLGANSLGWAVVETACGEPAQVLRAGVRVFESAMDGNLVEGREESRNRARREARLHRRQLWRKARRLRKTFNLLQKVGLLPAGPGITSEDRQQIINTLDHSIRHSAWFASKKTSGQFPEPDHVLPYIIRACALDEKIEPHLLGRALYQLAQRRGFLSNRRQIRSKANDDEGEVKKAIGDLRAAISSAGARTIGEYLAHSSPSERRIRTRWTARDMYQTEFDEIWNVQAKYQPELLTADRRKLLFRTIFHQRRLKFDPDAIGRCELERAERRAPAHLLLSQRFRLLDKVNNLLVDEMPLAAAKRDTLVNGLETHGDLTFKAIRKLLGIPKAHQFNLERGGDKSLPGNRTFAKFYHALGERWLAMSPEDRERLVEYVYAFEKLDKLEAAAKKKWSLDDDAARKLAAISLEPDYFSLSITAMRKLVPLLVQGIPFATARKQIYPDSEKPKEPLGLLPPVAEFGEIRNPAVTRSLTELRKVVNAIIRAYGKPAEIRIELARELKKPKWAREQATKRNRENQKARLDAAKRITAEIGIPRPSRNDIRKVLLADECGWHCPYTGRQISMRTLFSEPQFDVEHIIPFSRSLDDSFTNVTLCAIEENRNRKGNKTPFEAYSGDPTLYEQILGRVAGFSGDRGTRDAKLRRFKMTPPEVEALLGDFSSRQLNDTAHSARLAQRYLGQLYGGVIDAGGNRRVQATSGRATAYLRDEWKLNGILDDGATSNGGAIRKTRDDHRHHAVDAVAIALTDMASIKALSDAAQRAPAERKRRFGSVPAPWPDFVPSVRAQIEKIVVSHRASKKVSGALHKDTNYSLKKLDENGAKSHRVFLIQLSEKDVLSGTVIVDPGVAARVKDRFISLGAGDPAKVFSSAENLPYFAPKDGRQIPIRKVRIRETIKTVALRPGRVVRPAGNHHLEIFGSPGKDGRDAKWDCPGVVTMLEAHARKARREAIIRKAMEPPWEFRFSVAPGEIIVAEAGPYTGILLVVRTISEEEKSGSIKIEMVRANDARQKNQIKLSKQWITKSPNELLKWKAHKVAVNPLGEVSRAND